MAQHSIAQFSKQTVRQMITIKHLHLMNYIFVLLNYCLILNNNTYSHITAKRTWVGLKLILFHNHNHNHNHHHHHHHHHLQHISHTDLVHYHGCSFLHLLLGCPALLMPAGMYSYTKLGMWLLFILNSTVLSPLCGEVACIC